MSKHKKFKTFITRINIINYIGGMGYYMLTMAFMFMIVSWALQLPVSFVFEPVTPADPTIRQQQDSTESSGGSLLVDLLFIVPIAVLLVAIVLAFPYYIGKAVSGVVRWVIRSIPSSIQLSVAKTKGYFIGALIFVTFLTSVDYQTPLKDDILVLMIFLFTLLGAVFFILQYMLAAICKISFKRLL